MFQVAGICIWYFNFHLHSYIRCIYIYTMHVPPTHGYIQIEILFHHHWWLSVGIVQVHYLPKIRFCFLLTFKRLQKSDGSISKGFHMFSLAKIVAPTYEIWLYESNWLNLSKWDDFYTLMSKSHICFSISWPFFNPQTLPWSQRFFFPSQLQREAHLSTKKQHPPR